MNQQCLSLSRNDKGEEGIVIGKGITFGKKKGIDCWTSGWEENLSDEDRKSQEKTWRLLKDVPLDFITVTYEIIDKLSKKYHYPRIQEYLSRNLDRSYLLFYQALAQRYKG